MTLKIYGVVRSRAIRAIWVAEELGVPYELVRVDWADKSTRSPEFLAVNPNGHIPAIDDDGVVLWESMAINLYLARKHPGLWPSDTIGEGKAFQWSFWAVTEVEGLVNQYLYNTILLPEAERNPQAAVAARAALVAPLAVLADAVTATPFLAGNQFTIADLNVAQVFIGAYTLNADIGLPEALRGWLEQVFARPAAQRIIAMRKAS
ncbi:MAG: glutathione S-transferase family protein [Alphaproteobacteria bacterium]|nr:MAG: glutathione S-transferase family protein [Alphaproteobacteria bacterium]